MSWTTGVALPRAEIAGLLEDHPDIPVVIDEAYVDFGGESAVPLIADHPNLLVVQTISKSRALAGLRMGYALGGVGLIEALHRVKNSFNSYPLGRLAQAGATASVHDDAYFRESCARVVAGREAMTRELIRLGFVVLPSSANFVFARHPARGGPELAAALREHGGASAALQQAAHGALSAYHRRDGGRRATRRRLISLRGGAGVHLEPHATNEELGPPFYQKLVFVSYFKLVFAPSISAVRATRRTWPSSFPRHGRHRLSLRPLPG
jgi:histidinol-phosphate/aromatic aminotransferase/cobyric acid decarboxylase-like protein